EAHGRDRANRASCGTASGSPHENEPDIVCLGRHGHSTVLERQSAAVILPAREEGWPRGLRRTPGKCVYVMSVSRVRIPPLPPVQNRTANAGSVLWGIITFTERT